MLKEKKNMYVPHEKSSEKTHRSALAQQKPMFHRSFVLIWNKKTLFEELAHKIRDGPETFPKQSTPRTEYSFLCAKSGKKLWNVGF